MKFVLYAFVLSALCVGGAHAQTPDTTAAAPAIQKIDTSWRHTGVAGLTATQVSLSNWAQGGQNAIAWTVRLDGKSEMTVPRWGWTNTYKLAYGQAKVGEKSLRKMDDQIDLGSVLSYRSGGAMNAYCAFTLKTQFTAGYSYDVNDVRTPVSTFFDPAYLVESAGLEYKPSSSIKTRAGIALREVVTSAFSSFADDPKTLTVEKVKIEGGFESVTDMELKLDDNVLFTSHLELFDPITHLNQIILRSDNMVTAKVSKYIVVSLNLMLVNDVQVTSRTQVKQMLALGINYSIFGDSSKRG
jgi:hypothetical protein